MDGKKGAVMHEVVIHIILIAIIFSLFFIATARRADSRFVKQQIVEKQLALLIDSAIPGMDLKIYKINRNGIIDNLEIKNGEVFVSVGGLSFESGYPYFSKHQVSVEEVSVLGAVSAEGDQARDELNDAFVVRIR
ncbi:hypothetical protein HN630_00850 [archaeon]|jgi:hypothetical protein|nr:hypothetical protein [archaeon]MBT7567434.1 hypothetical protein [archaeon]